MLGVVHAFDDRTGLGVVVADDGTEYPFHATGIAAGTRTIATGTAVEFDIAPANLGRFEATGITPT
jgi:cold shock CspA family protein